MIKKISMNRNYPYTSTRVKAMKSMLLTRDDYLRMRNMGLTEIIRSLKDGRYRNEIEVFSKDYGGIELINLALNESLAADVNKLLLVASDELKSAIMVYSMKWAAGNIKITVRARCNRFNEKEIKYSIIPIKPTTREFCYGLLNKDLGDFVAEIKKIVPVDEEIFKSLYNSGDIAAVENMLDKAYYSSITSLLHNSRLRRFVISLIELTNIKNILRMKAYSTDSKAVKGIIVGKETAIVSKVANADKEKIGEIVKSKYMLDCTSTVKFENSMEKLLLQQSSRLMRTNPLSEAPVFGYLLAKEAEVRNLRLLVNAKAMGMDEGFIEENLILAG